MARKQAATLPPESEGSLQQKVCQLARACGWRFVHFRPGRTAKGWRTAFTGDAGFPDMVLVRRAQDRFGFWKTRLLFVELKRDGASVPCEQLEWLVMLNEVGDGVACYTWRPRDWEKIVEVLS